MSLLDLNFDNVEEPIALAEGEYEVRIMEMVQKTSANTGGEFIMAKLEVPSEPLSKEITHVMMLPTVDDDDKKRNNRLLSIQRFYEAFNVDYKSGPVNLDDLAGLNGWAILKVESSDEYGEQNRVARFVQGS